MAYNVEKLHTMENALRTTAELIGENASTPNQDGVKVGLGLTNEAQICNNAADAVKEGVFKTIVMGTFKNGKSTIINSLIGSKVLPEAVTPATAIISYLRYGTNDNKIYVYKDDGTVKEMSHQEFFNEYKFTDEDADEAKRTGTVKRFSDVDYSVVYCNMPILENGVQVLDSPGLEDKECATKVTLKAASNANAIIYTGTVVSGGFNMNDKEFFKSNFEGRQLNNVFFLINKSDLFEAEELEEVKKHYKTQLKDVFVDEKGDFNEELYAKRVFFISARNVLKKKTGEENYNKRDIPAFERFEKELEEFLTTDARSIATFNSCFTKIANAYKAATHTVELKAAMLEQDVENLGMNVEEAKRKLAQMKSELDIVNTNFEKAKVKTIGVIESELRRMVDSIEQTWDASMDEVISSSRLNSMDLVSLAWTALRYMGNQEQRDAAFSEKIAPITNGVSLVLENKIQESFDNMKVLIAPIIEELQKDVNLRLANITDLLDEIYGIFAPDVNGPTRESVNVFQALIAIINRDLNILIESMAGKRMGWMDFFKKSLIQMFVDVILFSVVGGPIGVFLFIFREWWQLKKGSSELTQKIAVASKSAVLSEMRKKINGEERDKINDKISKTFDDLNDKVSKPVLAKIEDETKLLDEVSRNYNISEEDRNAEMNRCSYLKDKIWETARNAYSNVFEKEITLAEFTQLSVQ